MSTAPPGSMLHFILLDAWTHTDGPLKQLLWHTSRPHGTFWCVHLTILEGEFTLFQDEFDGLPGEQPELAKFESVQTL